MSRDIGAMRLQIWMGANDDDDDDDDDDDGRYSLEALLKSLLLSTLFFTWTV